MLFDFIRRGEAPAEPAGPPRPAETKASAAGKVIAWQTTGRIAWSPRDTGTLTRAGFVMNPVGFRAVRLIAEAAAALPLTLSEEGTRFEEHPVFELVARPNPGQGQSEFLEAIYGQILLSGDAYVEAVPAAGAGEAIPAELYVLRSDRMRVVPGQDGWPEAYEYAVGAKKHVFRLGDGASPICHVRAFHPQDDHYGLSPMQAAAQAIDVHNSASRWSKALLDNAARPSGAIIYRGEDGTGTLTSEQYDRLLSEMESYHMGARNAGRPMLLEGGLDWKPMGFSPSDMEFHRTKEAAAREIALAFGVPPMLLGIPGDATYANYQEAHRAFYRLTVLPLAQRVTAALANWFRAHSGRSFRLSPDVDRIPALAPEREALWKRIGEADFLTAAEKRALLGLPPMAIEEQSE